MGLGIGKEVRPFLGPGLAHEAEGRLQVRRVGLRNRAMISGVNLIHQGPWGTPWMPSRTPEWHQALIVDTFTRSNSAATRERHRPSAR